MSDDKEKKLKKREKAFDVVYGIVLGFVVIVVGFYMYHFRSYYISLDPEDWGVFGDFMGGTLNPLLAFFSFMLLLLNLKLQREQLDNAEEQLKLNREELKLTRDELRKAADAQVDSAKVMNEQLKTQFLQQFDSNFYPLFEQMNDFLKQLSERYTSRIKILNSDQGLESVKSRIIGDRQLTRYFIFLYQILSLIDTRITSLSLLTDKERVVYKVFYLNLVRNQQPNRVLQLLFIHCAYGEAEYQSILIKYNFFTTLGIKVDGKHNLNMLSALHLYLKKGDVTKASLYENKNVKQFLGCFPFFDWLSCLSLENSYQDSIEEFLTINFYGKALRDNFNVFYLEYLGDFQFKFEGLVVGEVDDSIVNILLEKGVLLFDLFDFLVMSDGVSISFLLSGRDESLSAIKCLEFIFYENKVILNHRYTYSERIKIADFLLK